MSTDHPHPYTARPQDQPDDLALLRREVAALRREVTHLRTPRRRAGRARLVAAACLALFVALVPLGLLAANPFIDLTGGVHDGNIDAIYNAGITTGCDPTHYCPTANVTREEMASFLARTAGLGMNKPVANAAGLALASPVAGGPTYAANDLVRVTRASGSAPAIVGTSDDEIALATATLTAPGAGFVLVEANMQGHNTTGAGCPCELWARLRDTTNNATSPEWGVSYVDNTGAYDSASNHWVFPVAAGARSFVFEAYRSSGTSAGLEAYAQITALFVPFGGTGGGTLDTDNAPGGMAH